MSAAAYEAAMRRLTGEEDAGGAASEPHQQQQQQQQQQQRPAKRRRHGGSGGRGSKQHAPQPTSAHVPPRAGSLDACGLALGAALLPGACAGWTGGAAAARCGACGCGPGAHALLDARRHDGRGAPAARRAYLALREARALGYCADASTPLETRLHAQAARISRLLRTVAAADGSVAPLAEEAAALLPGIGGRPASTLRFVALLDSAYAELFIADCLVPPARAAGLPPPHVHLAALLPALPAPSNGCSECSTASHASASASGGLLCTVCAEVNPQLAYIRLRGAEAAGPLGLRRLAAACLAAEGPTPGPLGGTQRGADPVGCATLRLWQAASRDRVAAWSAFACPDAAAARALAAFCAADAAGGALLEVGAGTGYWAAYLARVCPSIRVVAHDSRPTAHAGGRTRLNEYHASLQPWFAVQPGDAAEVAASAASAAVSAGRPPPALLICYPPPCLAASGAGCMALAAVRAFAAAGGRRLALVGEWRGDTGSAALERELSAGWILDAPPIALPGFANTVAALTLWRRGQAGAAALRWAPACVACGAQQPLPAPAGGKAAGGARPFLRDRLTRAVVACSPGCASKPAAVAALDAELSARHLPPLRHHAASAAGLDLAFAWEDGDAALGKLVWRPVGGV